MPTFPSLLPLTAFEEYMFLDDRPAYPMSIVVRLRFSGRLDGAAATAAFDRTLARHPLLLAVVRRQTKRRLQWVAADRPPSLQWTSDLTHDRLPAMHPIDLTKEPGLRAWATADGQNSTVVLQAHHAACDGKGLLQIADDFLRGYAAAINGHCGAGNLSPCDDGLLRKRAAFGLSAWKLIKMLPAQLSGLIGARNFLFRQPVPLLASPRFKPKGLDDTDNKVAAECSEYEFPNVRVGRLKADELLHLAAAAAARKVTVNDWLLRDFFVAVEGFRRRHETTKAADWLRVSVPINLRVPSDAQMPAANIVSMVFLDRNAAQIANPANLLQDIHDEIAMVLRRRLGLTFIWSLMALRALPGGMAGRVGSGRCEATCVVSNLGRAMADSPLPRRGGKVMAGNVVLDEFDFFVPVREGTSVSLGLVFYADELQICLQYDCRRVTAAQADDLLASYLHGIRTSLGGAAAAARDKAA